MNKNKLALLTLPMFAFSAVAEAGHGTFADQRSYSVCRSAFQAVSVGLVTERHHFIDKRAGNPLLYLNGSRWEEGKRTLAKMSCETDLRGSRILSSEISAGRYRNPRTKVTTIELATLDK